MAGAAPVVSWCFETTEREREAAVGLFADLATSGAEELENGELVQVNTGGGTHPMRLGGGRRWRSQEMGDGGMGPPVARWRWGRDTVAPPPEGWR
jgi:N-methylhydantoinase B/oxoprolinase/acetone carboxylase alpha subunit